MKTICLECNKPRAEENYVCPACSDIAEAGLPCKLCNSLCWKKDDNVKKLCQAYRLDLKWQCSNIATHTTCDPVGGVVCEEHTCRCSKLFDSNVNAHVTPLPKPGTVSGPNVPASKIFGQDLTGLPIGKILEDISNSTNEEDKIIIMYEGVEEALLAASSVISANLYSNVSRLKSKS